MTMETGHKSKPKNSNGGRPPGHLGFEATLWATADKLRGNLAAAEYKHVVRGIEGDLDAGRRFC